MKHRKRLERIVDDFNSRFPVGTRVLLAKDDGEVETTVRHPAEILSGHSAVAWFVGVRGAHQIDGRVRVAPLSVPSVPPVVN